MWLAKHVPGDCSWDGECKGSASESFKCLFSGDKWTFTRDRCWVVCLEERERFGEISSFSFLGREAVFTSWGRREEVDGMQVNWEGRLYYRDV